jgi:hypothetical protein
MSIFQALIENSENNPRFTSLIRLEPSKKYTSKKLLYSNGLTVRRSIKKGSLNLFWTFFIRTYPTIPHI